VYAEIAPAYDVLREGWSRLLGRGIEATIYSWILRYVPHSPSVLDLGCGTGANLARLLRLGITPRAYVGVDASADMLRIALARFGELPFVAFRQSDAHDLDESLGPFDLAISTYALSHVDAPRRLIEKSLRVLAPNGRAVFAFFSRPKPVLRPLLRPFERSMAFRCLPPEAHEGLPGTKEVATFQGGLMTAVLLSPVTDGGGEG
jgi:SAM-dependent methyltransferase